MSPTKPLPFVATLATTAALALGLSLAPATAAEPTPRDGAAASAAPAVAEKRTRTPFVFKGNGYGTVVEGGDLPVDSSRVALSSMACTTIAGKKNRNFVEETEVPGLGTVRGVFSRVVSKKKGTTTFQKSKHKVAEIVLAETPLGSLSISGIVSTTKASFDTEEGWASSAVTKIAGITLTPAGGDPIQIDIPSPGQTIPIPGIANISLGRMIEKPEPDKNRSRAYAVGVVIEVIPTGTTVKVARSMSKLEKGFKTGIFGGSAIPVKANVLGELVQVGRVVRQTMPCLGTDNEWQAADAADVNLGDQIVVQAASARQKGKQTKKKAVGTEVARIAKLDLGDGALVLDAIESKAKVTRLKNGRLKRSASAKVGAITAGGGDAQSLEDLDGLEIPGLLKIETGLKKKIKNGIRIIGLRITLLDGTGAVVDLATSKVTIADR
ncbi:MAG: choice-of-anchor P family protein [Nocardioides marinisabuli]|uniref:choice-of-anchor P family protein n=1 Tax=Nocardioides marinisabuli TaxID=419476 RepID=UPI00321BA15F